MKVRAGYLFLICLFSLYCGNVSAVIREMANVSELNDLLEDDDLILFDVDDTIVDPGVALGTGLWSEWWKQWSAKLHVEGISIDRLQRFGSRFGPILWAELPLRPVEPHLPQMLAALQKQGIMVLALTARCKRSGALNCFDEVTRDNLTAVGVDMRRSRLPAGLTFDKDEGQLYAFSHGVIFTHYRPKGPALVEFLRARHWKPKRVVLVDDTLGQIQSVANALEAEGIEFIGLYYRRAEKNHTNFHPVIAAVQLRAFLSGGPIPSDEEAFLIGRKEPDRNADSYLRPFLDWMQEDVSQSAAALN